ncbi:MAG: phosphotransferase [Phycisphaerae bacterium]
MIPPREHFTPAEIAVVLRAYDLEALESARELTRGSRRSPKLLLHTRRGRFLLKRRAAGRDQPDRVAFAHALAEHLRGAGFPVPALRRVAGGEATFVEHEGRIYELFEYTEGAAYDGSLEETTRSGQALARFHRVAQTFQSLWQPTRGGYHDSPAVRSGLNAIPSTTAGHDSVVGHEAELLGMTQELYERYDESAEAVRGMHVDRWPRSVIHGDWHPGNMLFRAHRVAVVLDLDSVRVQPPVVDLANGMLQFSMLRGASEPGAWPEYFDETRMRRFFLGYRMAGAATNSQRRALPHLMIESLIAESAVPIAATGSFGPIPGFGVLQMVRRKVRWILNNFERLQRWMME